ncbi:MFS general substrate transporter [Cryphonectria parasitica EP155]|uniref:MFS general substrate transporter n=1 Tax=Cryphonectria parasitica (strain ATCC 38755 / EP155) TaxID=660469 RepID=A0A9P4Y1Y6_CRYP1|nr:MFS general substrate transporter [Cryphonectria parasitica EP155]KAF3765178.1 MFS general substrate transporter [Cryphonectria parasitica EP155]
MIEKDNAENDPTGILSSDSSAVILLKDDPPNGGLRAWLQVLGAFFMYFNTWGIVSSYGSYQEYYEESILSTSTSFQVSAIGAIQSFFMVFLGFLAGPIFDKGYFKPLVRGGTLLVLLGTVTQGFSTRYWQLLLSQGVCVGVGMGCLAVPSIAVPSAWFTTKMPLANGIIVSASGFGGVVYPIMIKYLIPLVGFRYASLSVALVVFVTLGISNVVMSQPESSRPKRAFFDRTVLTDVPYLLFVLGCVLTFLGLYTTFFYVADFAVETNVIKEGVATYLVTVLNAASILGRILPNIPQITQGLGPFNMMIISVSSLALLVLCLNADAGLAGLMTIVSFYGFFTGSYFSLQPTIFWRLTADMNRHGTRMGMASTCMSFGLLIGAPASGALLRTFGFQASWAWSGVTLFLGSMAILGSRGLTGGWCPFKSV